MLEMPEGVYSCEVIQARDGACYAQFALDHASKTAGDALGADKLAAVLALVPREIGFLTHAPRIYAALGRSSSFRSGRAPRFRGRAPRHRVSCGFSAKRLAPILHRRHDSAGQRDSRAFIRPGGVEDPASGGPRRPSPRRHANSNGPRTANTKFSSNRAMRMGRSVATDLAHEVFRRRPHRGPIGGQAVEMTTGELQP